MSDSPSESEEEAHAEQGSEPSAGTVTDDTDEGHVTTPEQEFGETAHDTRIERTTAPQSPYTSRDVGVGIVVLLVGLLVAFVLPFVLL